MAAFTELFVHGWLNIAGGFIAILGMGAMTLLLYGIFEPVNRSLSLLAALSSFVALGFEALRWHPWGVNVAMVSSDAIVFCLPASFLARPFCLEFYARR